jgi:hypothetical protein
MAYVLANAYASATIIQPLIKTSWFAKATKADAVTFPEEAGIVPLNLLIHTTGASGITSSASEGWSYCTVCVSEGVAGVTDTSIAYATAAPGGERRESGYYVRTPNGEIMYVLNDSGYSSTSGTLTVKRGALGTTPASIVHSTYLEVLCSLHLYGEGTGNEWIVYLPMPKDPAANFW